MVFWGQGTSSTGWTTTGATTNQLSRWFVDETASTSGWFNATNTTSTGTYVGLAAWTDDDTTSAQQAMWVNQYQRMYLQAQQMTFQEVRAHQEAVNRQYADTIRRQQEAEAEANRRYAEVQKKREEASKRAQELLLSHLTPEQRESVRQNKWFIVEGGKSKKKYRIKTNAVAGNVEELDAAGKVVARYCCHADGSIPFGDQHLTQMLTLAYDEDYFTKRANRTPIAA